MAGATHALFVALPVISATRIQGRQPLTPEGPGIDTDRMTKVRGVSALLGGVPAHHDLSIAVRRDPSELFPEEHERVLVFQRHVGGGIGMDKKVGVCFMEWEGSLDELPMGLRNRP